MSRIPVFLFALGLLSSCFGNASQEPEKALAAYQQEVIAAAGIDTTTLDNGGKLILRQLLCGCRLCGPEYDLTAYRFTNYDNRVAQTFTAQTLERQDYVRPSEEWFRERIRRCFGLTLRHSQYIGDNNQTAKWIPIVAPDFEENDVQEYQWIVYIDPEQRYVEVHEDQTSMEYFRQMLPLNISYRSRYPQLNDVERYIDRKKLLALQLDCRDVPQSEHPMWELKLYSDLENGSHYPNQPSTQCEYNRFLFNDDHSSFRTIFQHMEGWNYDPLLCILGNPSQPGFRTGTPVSEVLDLTNPESVGVKIPYWKIFSLTVGDLNGDGLDDMAACMGIDDDLFHGSWEEQNDPSSEGPDEQMRNRVIWIALRDKTDQELRIQHCLSNLAPLTPGWHSNMDDPFSDLQIADGKLTLNERLWMSAGSWWMATYDFVFEYDSARAQFLLTKYAEYNRHRATAEENTITIDLKQGKMESSHNAGEDTDTPEPAAITSVTQYFAALPLIAIDNLRRGETFRVSEEEDPDKGLVTISTME